MKFRDYFSLKHILFAVVVIALMLVFAVRQSNNTVKISFGQNSMQVTSSKYSMTVEYRDVTSATLIQLPEAGERVADAYDDNILRTGIWVNDTLGEYIIVADLDVSNCIKLTLHDGRILVFSRKDDATTKEIYDRLSTYLKQ